MSQQTKENQALKAFPFTGRQISIFANIFFWVLFIVFDSITTSATLSGYYSYSFARTLIHCVLFVFLIYPNLYWLYPRFFSAQQYGLYGLGLVFLLMINLFLRFQVDMLLSTPERVAQYLTLIYNPEMSQKALAAFVNGGFISKSGAFAPSYYLGMTIGSIGVLMITTPIKLVEDWYEKKRLQIQVLKNQATTQQTELQLKNKELELQDAKIRFLKAQSDPHFLVNALSGVYNLALLQSDKIDISILRLSELMGYLLGQGQEEKISLKSEIEFIENYLNFSRLIHLDEVNIAFQHNATPQQLETIEIPPMLFQPFLENALKHSDATDNPNGWIKSSLEIRDSSIIFQTKNTVKPKKYAYNIPSFGVGLPNVKERLALYFPEKHELKIAEEEDSYEVRLILFR